MCWILRCHTSGLIAEFGCVRNSDRSLTLLSSAELAVVEVAEPGTVAMTDEQYAAAAHALAVLINEWRDSQRADDPGLPAAA